jgi:hypothetical protein
MILIGFSGKKKGRVLSNGNSLELISMAAIIQRDAAKRFAAERGIEVDYAMKLVSDGVMDVMRRGST